MRIVVGTIWLCAVASLGLAAACQGPTDPMVRGAARYDQCAPCHGQRGDGNVSLAAPPIAGLPPWYVEAQLGKFRMGARGAHVDDSAGLRMRSMAQTMPTERDVKAVSHFVASLPRAQRQAASVEGGDAARGQVAWASCAACHGADSSGNQALFAPPLAGQADWYLLAQLRGFKRGWRGAHPRDPNGKTMQALAAALDDQQMKDLVAYLATLAAQ